MTEPNGRFSQWLRGETDLFDEARSLILNQDGVPPADPPKKKPKRRKTGAMLHRRYTMFHILFVTSCILLLALLLSAVMDLPTFGDPYAPSSNEVSDRYVADGLEETGALNAVAGMILDYRAFDTFGESTVLFAAAISVLFLLQHRTDSHRHAFAPVTTNENDLILQTAVRISFPFILMFGSYVVLNGHLSPGGGFSGGAVLGAGLILYGAAFGREGLSEKLPPERTSRITVICLLIYAALKCFSFFTGANHMAIEIPKGIPGAILSSGFILPLNICVGIIVACTIFNFFLLITEGDD
ncbi:MAG: MnhB domain-containing protein [Oscillospiraceae bacterium]|nr:MnhB domain-containing protein [Oscillospiraceae bacterium]